MTPIVALSLVDEESYIFQRDPWMASEGVAARTIATLDRTLQDRGDPGLFFSAEVAVELPSR